MASDGPTPPPCDPELWEHGEVVFQSHSIPPNAFEAFVQKLAAESGQRVDWHYVGGRAVVRALGDLERVREALEKLKPEHDALQAEHIRRIIGDEAADIYLGVRP